MGWTANNKFHCTGSITSGLTLSIDNADAGTVPTDMSVTTYNDGTYSDYTYDITAIFEGTFESSFSNNDVRWTSVGDSNDIKYQIASSEDGITFNEYTAESDAIGTTQITVSAPYFKLRLIWYSSQWADSDSFQVDTITRKFSIFTNAETIDANKWMTNLYIVGQGDLLPREGTEMAVTTSSVDIGSLGAIWDNIYLSKTLEVNNDLGGTIVRAASVELSTTATRIEISGLIGASDLYFLHGELILATTTAVNSFIFFNQDSATNYGMIYTGLSGTWGQVINSNTSAGVFVGGGGSAASYYSIFNAIIKTSESNGRMLIGSGGSELSTAQVGYPSLISGIWNNTSDTLTSIQIYNTSKFSTKTKVTLWKRQ